MRAMILRGLWLSLATILATYGRAQAEPGRSNRT